MQTMTMNRRTLALMGIGAAAAATAAGLGAYMYRKPRLRKKMAKSKSVAQAAVLLGQEIRHDSADVAHDMTAAMYDGMASGLKRTRNVLGMRFLRSRRKLKAVTPAKIGARHIKNEAKHLKNTVKNEARHAAGALSNEMERISDEAVAAKDMAVAQMAK